MVADRRLSGGGRFIDNAIKIMTIETSDGCALLGYAGLGSTAAGTQPSNWMSKVLRGRNLPMVQSLQCIADAMEREFVSHMRPFGRVAVASHTVVAAAFVGNEHRLYVIHLDASEARPRVQFNRCADEIVGMNGSLTPHVAAVGSGIAPLQANSLELWKGSLLRLVRAYNKGKVSDVVVSDFLARKCLEIHGQTKDVGPNCLVAWRHPPSERARGSGGLRAYNGEVVWHDGTILPDISKGFDQGVFFRGLFELLMSPKMREQRKRYFSAAALGDLSVSPPEIPRADVENLLRSVPRDPDEKLK